MDATKASWGGTKACEITAWELYLLLTALFLLLEPEVQTGAMG